MVHETTQDSLVPKAILLSWCCPRLEKCCWQLADLFVSGALISGPEVMTLHGQLSILCWVLHARPVRLANQRLLVENVMVLAGQSKHWPLWDIQLTGGIVFPSQ